jgi:hypothetical protein
MPLDAVSLAAEVAWKLSKDVTGFKDVVQGQDTKSYSLLPAVATFNQILLKQYTILASGTQTVNVHSFTNVIEEAVTSQKAVFLFVLPTGAGVSIEPGAADPLDWFLSGTSPVVTVQAGGLFVISEPLGTTVNNTTKNLLFTNISGAATLTLTLVICVQD